MTVQQSGGFHFNSLDMHREPGVNSPYERRRAEARIQEMVPEDDWREVYAMLFYPLPDALEIRRAAKRRGRPRKDAG